MAGDRIEYVQNCWVVANIDDAMQGWLAAGVGPFFRHDSHYPEALYRGTPVPLSFKCALAQAGPVQIELIEQTSPGPSAYRDIVAEGQSGFHHMCRIVDDVDREVDALAARGIKVATEFSPMPGMRVVYADTRPEIGCMLEVVPALPVLLSLQWTVAEAAKNWDGRDPIRQRGAPVNR